MLNMVWYKLYLCALSKSYQTQSENTSAAAAAQIFKETYNDDFLLLPNSKQGHDT